MSIILPEGVAKLFSILTGMKWPQSDEDMLRTAGDDYQTISDDLLSVRDYFSSLVTDAGNHFSGTAANAFTGQMSKVIGNTGGTDYLTSASSTAKQLADFAHQVANQVEYTKWMTIAQLVQLAAEIAWAIALGPITFGTSLTAILAEELLAAELIKKLFGWLIRQIILHEFLSITGGLLLDVIIQSIQIGEHHKTSWDWKSTLQGLEFGAINGLLAGPLELFGFGFGKLFGKIFGGGIGNILAKDIEGLAGGALKDAIKDAEKFAAEAVDGEEKNLLEDGLNLLEKEGEGGLEGFEKEVAESLAEDGAEKLSKVDKFAEEMGSLFEERLGGILNSSLTRELGEDAAKEIAEDAAKKALGNAARTAGLKFARSLAAHDARYAVDQLAVIDLLKKALGVLPKAMEKSAELTVEQLAELETHREIIFKMSEEVMGLAGKLAPRRSTRCSSSWARGSAVTSRVAFTTS